MFDLNDMERAEKALMKLVGEALKREPTRETSRQQRQNQASNSDSAPKCPYAGEVRA